MSDYGRDVRNARLRKGWSRRQLAEESGTTIAQINSIENGEANPAPVMEALNLVNVEVLTTDVLAAFTLLIHPLLMKMPEDRIHIVLAAVLDTVARGAAGLEPIATVGQVTLVTGDVSGVDIDQKLS